MAKTSTFTTQFRRRREGKTDYNKRLGLIKSKSPRLIVRKTNRYIIVQVVQFDRDGDKTLVSVNSKQLHGLGWKAGKKNLPAAYLTGLLAGVKAKKKKVDKANLDLGFAMPVHKGFWASALKGAIDAGLEIPADEGIFPSEDRISGKHVEEFAKSGKKDSKQFGKLGKDANLLQLSKTFSEVKQKIKGLGGQ